MADILRWRRIAPGTIGAAVGGWETVPASTGDAVPLVRAVSWQRGDWHVQCRVTPDVNFADGWHWQDVIIPEEATTGYLTNIITSTSAAARAAAEHHWDHIAKEARVLLREGIAEQETAKAAAATPGEPVTPLDPDSETATAAQLAEHEREMAQAAREAKLPRWARTDLDLLRARVADLEERLARERRGPGGLTVDTTNTAVLEPYSEPPTPLLPDSHIRFYAGANGKERAYLDAQLRLAGGVPYLRIRSNDLLAIVPETANAVHVYAQWDQP